VSIEGSFVLTNRLCLFFYVVIVVFFPKPQRLLSTGDQYDNLLSTKTHKDPTPLPHPPLLHLLNKILNIAIQNVVQPNKSPVGVPILAYHPIYLGGTSVVFIITGRIMALE
jgi:hypothetical protein